MTCEEIEVVVAKEWNVRTHLIIPNISWGLQIHECDLLVVTRSGYCTEVEIKISKADLKKDISKRHGHKSNKIKYLFFAIPEELETDECIAMIPERAGIFVIKKHFNYGNVGVKYVKQIRGAKPNKDCRKLTDKEMIKVMELGCMRIWSLKNVIQNLKHTNKHLRDEIKNLKKV